MMKDKMKDLMKKVTSSSAPSFKGPSHVLGSGPPPSASTSSSRPSQTNPNPNPRPVPKQQPPRPAGPSEFTPFTAVISSSSSRRPDANGGDTVACPNCGDAFSSEHAVSEHLDGCLASAGGARARAAAYLAGNPPPAAVEVVKKLLGNLLKEPGNDKYRRVRLGNPRIKEAVADREGGLELLEAVGFTIGDEGGELFAVMDETPAEARLSGIRQAVLLLERSHPSAPLPTLAGSESKESCRSGVDEQKEVNKIVDRQIRVFFNVRGSSVAEIDTPDSFYKLSGEEVRNEAKMRRERLEQSRLLIPKSYKEKQALAARQKYKQAVIRVQFPDGVILQGVFLPAEATGSLYEFVADALKQPGLEFDLICPAVPRSRVLPHSPNTGERARTLQDEGLVPSALLKFKPNETDSVVFTGLLDKLLEASEPFTAASS
nr:LOW QUALITY PROTEIN: plant UBX domain-containing protein 2 [Aegilops tauschii subsp. strangulata]